MALPWLIERLRAIDIDLALRLRAYDALTVRPPLSTPGVGQPEPFALGHSRPPSKAAEEAKLERVPLDVRDPSKCAAAAGLAALGAEHGDVSESLDRFVDTSPGRFAREALQRVQALDCGPFALGTLRW
eukprot:CAMPEP_0167819944 /NCGR_PEP_ID=MMETSP0112_2-20121227/5759_1 /TAXON_ID=91324 /ORGANISM="Lotharella globosa, Strain CCCM811" /LENGTH=128 /DNA_ID=CAMNT_0007720331 /DNA_START=522 /DNA_END=904 /DNA_ORIENTATION=-